MASASESGTPRRASSSKVDSRRPAFFSPASEAPGKTGLPIRVMLRDLENHGSRKSGETHRLQLSGSEPELIHPGELQHRIFAHAHLQEPGDGVAGCEGLVTIMKYPGRRDAVASEIRPPRFGDFGDLRLVNISDLSCWMVSWPMPAVSRAVVSMAGS